MFCFFKQKTAYEMRISDWSSDVCSSDLHVGVDYANQPVQGRRDERRIRRPDGVPRDYGRRLDSLAGKAGRKHEGSALGSTPALCGKLAHLLSRSHRDPLDHPGRQRGPVDRPAFGPGMGGDATAVETGNLPALRRRKPSSRGCREFAGLLESRVGVLRKGAVSRGRREASELKHIASMLRSAGPDGSVSSVWIRGSVPDALHE